MSKKDSISSPNLTSILCTLEQEISNHAQDIKEVQSLCTRLHRNVVRDDKLKAEFMAKSSRGVVILVQALTKLRDEYCVEQLLQLAAYISQQGGKKAKLNKHGLCKTLLKVLSRSSPLGGKSNEFTIALYSALAETYPLLDSPKASVNDLITTTLTYAQQKIRQQKLITPILRLLDAICSENETATAVLGKRSGVVFCLTVVNIHNAVVLSNQTVMLKALGLLKTLIKLSKTNAVQCTQKGGLRLMLSLFEDWNKRDSRNKLVDVRIAIVKVIKCLIIHDSGKAAFLAQGGVRILFGAAKDYAGNSETDSISTWCMATIRVCQPHAKIPSSPGLAFLLPQRSRDSIEPDRISITIPDVNEGAPEETDHDIQDCPVMDMASYFPEVFPASHQPEDMDAGDSEGTPEARSLRDPLTHPVPQQHTPTEKSEPLMLPANVKTKRRLMMDDINQFVAKNDIMDKLVYDIDQPKTAAKAVNCLKFESRFECGNLRLAHQVYRNVYDLVLCSDINSPRHTQWFFFAVKGMTAETPYRFNIVNLEKPGSQFNFGMQPVVYCPAAHKGWRRSGSDMCYYQNDFLKPGTSKSFFYTTSFTISFPLDNETCFMAYHYPYAYSTLQTHLQEVKRLASTRPIFFRLQRLCKTLGGNWCNMLTITSSNESQIPVRDREYIVLSARVHPGETNASWVMKGALDFLTGEDPDAEALRTKFVFKIVPMLNPDGVINGNHRCNLAGDDLNRQWINPSKTLHPTVFYLKQFMRYLTITLNRRPLMFCDFHGHSRKKNVFMFGCCTPTDGVVPEKIFPKLLAQHAEAVSFKNCKFAVERSKESTARIVMWKELGIQNSFTLESSYCGADQGKYKRQHFGTNHLEEVGRDFCRTLLKYNDPKVVRKTEEALDRNSVPEVAGVQIFAPNSTDQTAA